MNDLDRLRAALREPPAEALGVLDPARVLAAGKRVRRRRRLRSGAGLVRGGGRGGARRDRSR